MPRTAIILIFILTIFPKPLFAANEEWNAIESAYFTIYYKPDCNVKKIERRLRTRYFYVDEYRRQSKPENTEEKIAYRMDLLLKKIKEILGMHPRKMNLTIKIFKNKKELYEEYENIFNSQERHKAFYVHKYTTIYTTEGDISDSVMSHEIGHAVVDHYFVVRPPERVRELLAQYVDLHLED